MLQELAVHLVTNRQDVPTLLGTEEVSRPADFKVSHGNPEASTKHGIPLQGAKAFQSGWVFDTMFWKHQVTKGPFTGTPHSTSQLVKLRETKAIGVPDDHRVCPWDIKAVFDNGG